MAANNETVAPAAWKVLSGSAVGYAMDGFDLLILGFMLRFIAKDLGLTPTQGASLVTATLIGAVLGGLVFGMLSDRLGRVRVLTWTIIVFAVFTGLRPGPRLLRPDGLPHGRRPWPRR
ncbi:MAG: MFS transporter [Rhodopila sp.]